jgi:hypothetical protein
MRLTIDLQTLNNTLSSNKGGTRVVQEGQLPPEADDSGEGKLLMLVAPGSKPNVCQTMGLRDIYILCLDIHWDANFLPKSTCASFRDRVRLLPRVITDIGQVTITDTPQASHYSNTTRFDINQTAFTCYSLIKEDALTLTVPNRLYR